MLRILLFSLAALGVSAGTMCGWDSTQSGDNPKCMSMGAFCQNQASAACVAAPRKDKCHYISTHGLTTCVPKAVTAETVKNLISCGTISAKATCNTNTNCTYHEGFQADGTTANNVCVPTPYVDGYKKILADAKKCATQTAEAACNAYTTSNSQLKFTVGSLALLGSAAIFL